MKKYLHITLSLLTILGIFMFIKPAFAGSLTPPGAPADTMYTLTDLSNLASGTTGTLGSGTLPSTPGSVTPTFQSLTSIYTALSAQVANLLSGAAIASGTTAFGFTGTFHGDTDATKVLTTALHPGTYDATNLPITNVLNTVSFGAGKIGTLVTILPTTGLPKTNQTVCYDPTDLTTVISCTGTGQDGELQKNHPRSYTDNGDGTITDNVTGLVWQKCTAGQTGSDCSGGSPTGMLDSDALTYCNSNTAGLPGSGWYLPNIYQLFSLADFGASGPVFINLTYFPNSTSVYWSSTSRLTIFSSALGVSYNGVASTQGYDKSFPNEVRCVR